MCPLHFINQEGVPEINHPNNIVILWKAVKSEAELLKELFLTNSTESEKKIFFFYVVGRIVHEHNETVHFLS